MKALHNMKKVESSILSGWPRRVSDSPTLPFATCSCIVRSLGAMPSPNSCSTICFTPRADLPLLSFFVRPHSLSVFYISLAYRVAARLYAFFLFLLSLSVSIASFDTCSEVLLVGFFAFGGVENAVGCVTNNTKDSGDFKGTQPDGPFINHGGTRHPPSVL